MTSPVIIASYTSPWEAHIACGRLLAEGIHAWVAYEQHVWAYWPMSTALGGVRIMTDAANASEAKAILTAHDRGEYESCLSEEDLQAATLHCPKCDSTDVETLSFGSGIPLLAVLAFFGAIFPVRLDRHHCQHCGNNWRY
jgi:hypothetical protein